MRKLRSILIAVTGLALSAGFSAAEPLAVGKKVPPVKSTDTEGKEFDFGEQLKMGTTLVFFFPKANTGG